MVDFDRKELPKTDHTLHLVVFLAVFCGWLCLQLWAFGPTNKRLKIVSERKSAKAKTTGKDNMQRQQRMPMKDNKQD